MTVQHYCSLHLSNEDIGHNEITSVRGTNITDGKRWEMLGISSLVGGKPVLPVNGVIDINYSQTPQEPHMGGFTHVTATGLKEFRN